jgi:RNA polymerase sigma-70 factor (ECF subfamily)
MTLCELTLEQQTFAEEHHNLVYAFLHKKNLHGDDYYDVIVFGYLRAVQKYLLRTDLRRKYAFSTIAWRAMECELGRHRRAQSCPMRRAVTVSLEAVSAGIERLMPTEDVCGSNRLPEQLEDKFLWEEVFASLPREQAEILRMKADGYSTREIAVGRKRQCADIENMISGMREPVLGLCSV